MQHGKPLFDWLDNGYERDGSGWTVQQIEAVTLYAVAAMLSPQRIVEFGFHRGHSAVALLEAVPTATLCSVDCTAEAEAAADELKRKYGKRFTYLCHDHAAPGIQRLLPSDIDFVFLDGSHDFDVNRVLLERTEPLLSPQCVLAVHDTGVYYGRRHQPGERETVNWLRTRGWGAVNLHCRRERRHGLTLLQRQFPLD